MSAYVAKPQPYVAQAATRGGQAATLCAQATSVTSLSKGALVSKGAVSSKLFDFAPKGGGDSDEPMGSTQALRRAQLGSWSKPTSRGPVAPTPKPLDVRVGAPPNGLPKASRPAKAHAALAAPEAAMNTLAKKGMHTEAS